MLVNPYFPPKSFFPSLHASFFPSHHPSFPPSIFPCFSPSLLLFFHHSFLLSILPSFSLFFLPSRHLPIPQPHPSLPRCFISISFHLSIPLSILLFPLPHLRTLFSSSLPSF